MAIWHMRIAYWLTKAKTTHSEYVIFIVFPRKQWLHERASMLRCTNIDLKLIQNHEIICRNITQISSSYLTENTFSHCYMQTVPDYCENLTENTQCVKKRGFLAF
jgi:hypothetical protein